MKNWKTSLAGFITLILLIAYVFKLINTETMLTSISVLTTLLGFLSKDYDKTRVR